VFVNGRPRSVIMEDMQRRIERGDGKQEKLDAIEVGENGGCPELKHLDC
jgi:hypothetical protein